MKVLIINAGSSSLKYQLVDMSNEEVLAKGNCERIAVDGKIGHKANNGYEAEYDIAFPTHKEAFLELIKLLTEGEHKVIDSVADIDAVGHRVVHGSDKYIASAIVTPEVISDIDSFADICPLHNPAHATAMRACVEAFGENVPMVAVFDTAFHQTMPEKAFMFGLPYKYYEEYKVRRYGFHGTSHRYISARYTEIAGKQPEKLITCHLGNGSSICAIENGKVVDTSMGLTPLDGFVMGTRCGAIDPSVVTYIMKKENLTPDQMSDIMNKQSGFLGISGVSSDGRDLWDAANSGNKQAQLAIEMVTYQITKVVGGYAAAMGGVDAILFTGGIGENDTAIREGVLKQLGYMGVDFDAERNKTRQEARISADGSKVDVWVVPTNEEIVIARDTVALTKK